MAKLYEIPKGSKIKVEEGIITFHHLDGAYSYCTADWIEDDDKGSNVVNLSGNTPLVYKREKEYELDYNY